MAQLVNMPRWCCWGQLLTYMSIRGEIRERIAEGRLFALEPVIERDQVSRTMLISREIKDLLSGPWEDVHIERRAGRLRADLERFLKGQVVGLCLTPYEAASAYMGRLDQPKDEVWDIRSVDPSPGLRVFGRFAEVDIFIALLWVPRSKHLCWSERKPLGDRHSLEWQLAIIECQQKWEELFPGYSPVHGDNVNDYVSANAFPV